MAQDQPNVEKPVEEQAREQTGQRQVQLRIDESKMAASYANAFRTNGTAEEVMLDFGVNQRVIMNYFSAKRLAVTLGQLIRRHEEQFGNLELDVSRRRKA